MYLVQYSYTGFPPSVRGAKWAYSTEATENLRSVIMHKEARQNFSGGSLFGVRCDIG
jgi:hypothetical protein